MTLTKPTRQVAGSIALALGTLALAACGDSNGQHASDGDTGAAAPATTIDMSATPKTADSTLGVAAPSGSSAPAGTTDTTKKVTSPTSLPSTSGTSAPKRP